mmetsp:Transcript_11564/g.16007  ORF Transcript_11564/g.16007 Transcript_11564/m.16007 type:complete len:260 (+) Transcript_11564:2275-3054(+)
MFFYYDDEMLKINIESVKNNKYYKTDELKIKNYFPMKNHSSILDFKNNRINRWSLIGKTHSKTNQNLLDFYRLIFRENITSNNLLISYKIIEIIAHENQGIINDGKSSTFSQITCKSLIINKSDYRLFFKSLVVLELKTDNFLSNAYSRLYGLQGLNYYSEKNFLSANKYQLESSIYLDTRNENYKRIYLNGYKTKLFFNMDKNLLFDISIKKGYTDFVINTERNGNQLLGVGNIARRVFLNPNEMFFGEFNISMNSKY